MKDFFGEKGYKKIVIAFCITIVLTIITFVLILSLLNKKTTKTIDFGLLNVTNQIVANENTIYPTSISKDKGINEVINEALNSVQIENKILTQGKTGEVVKSNDEKILESESVLEETESTESEVDVPIVEEIVTEEPVVEESREIVEVELDDIYYLVPETETAATAIGMYSLTDGQISLKGGNEEKWIDRLDLSDATEIREFYDTLVEASDNDGEEDFLIDDAYLSTDYNLTITEVKKTVEVNLSNAAD